MVVPTASVANWPRWRVSANHFAGIGVGQLGNSPGGIVIGRRCVSLACDRQRFGTLSASGVIRVGDHVAIPAADCGQHSRRCIVCERVAVGDAGQWSRRGSQAPRNPVRRMHAKKRVLIKSKETPQKILTGPCRVE